MGRLIAFALVAILGGSLGALLGAAAFALKIPAARTLLDAALLVAMAVVSLAVVDMVRRKR
jgi:uncharacterized membrane protein YsdA (DUF1294 family)